MRTRVLGAVVAGALLLPQPAPAQQLGVARGTAPIRSTVSTAPAGTLAPLDRPGPVHPRPAPGEDLFRARPWTYAPRYDRLPHRRFPGHLFFPGSFAIAAPVYVTASWWPVPVAEPDSAAVNRPSTVYVRPSVEPQRPEPYAPGAPGPAKTLYVIPGCYAGDAPPRPDLLPDGCDAADVRVILPRPR